MNQTSPAFHRILLVLAALTVFGAIVWAGMQVFQPVPIPPVPPAKPLVSFEPSVDVRNNPLFGGLSAVFRGFVYPGVMGRPNPFSAIGVDTSASSSAPQSGLPTAVEVSLNGAQALALTPSKDGGVLVLTGIPDSGGNGWVYEIRRHAEEGVLDAVARWNVPAVPEGGLSADALTPTAILEDNQGKVWLLSREGRMGSIGPGGQPIWAGAALFTNVSPSRVSRWGGFALDGAGRIWVTDGTSVFVGNGSGFQNVDLLAQLGDARAGFEAFATPAHSHPLPDGWLHPASSDFGEPRRLQALAGGRMAVVTPAFGVIFPVTFQGPSEVLFANTTTSQDIVDGVALAYAPNGDLWGTRGETALVRRWLTGKEELANETIMPRQARSNPFLFVSDRESLYALDYSVNGTILWKETDGDWTAQVVLPSGPQPNDLLDKVVIDQRGDLWAILAHRGLLRVRMPRQ